MRKEKIEELRSYIEELKTKKLELLDKNSKFLKVERYNCDLNNKESKNKNIKNFEENYNYFPGFSFSTSDEEENKFK